MTYLENMLLIMISKILTFTLYLKVPFNNKFHTHTLI